ncbi:hypothetical protein A7A76_16455 [Lysobacter enzymogenes]|uniref:hypothetical protein n=1 Tax=Lysobacter enzymogenes TaxID=69 RepID=UPI0019D1D732|nr:hypothetical protein [Lysobacter enzymogenes]MBN7136335.1 hypothetical protein [Lysobacter enzymogenes]
MGFAQGRLVYGVTNRFFRAAMMASVLVSLLACDNEVSSPAQATPVAAAASQDRKAYTPKASVSESAQPEPACPSQQFDTFLKAFANSADLQDAFSSHPVRHKYPYYWKHNTQPGDPAHPKWVVDDEPGAARVKYRYDAASDRFIWSGKKLKAGQRWTSIQADETDVSYAALADFRIRRVSGVRYEVEYDEGDIDTYELISGCWRFAQRWEREAIVECKWPDECRSQREFEAPMK